MYLLGAPLDNGWLGLTSLLTYQFTHGNWFHLIGNFAFGLPYLCYLERKIGSRSLLNFYVLCGLGGALLHASIAGMGVLVGASGSLFGCALGACQAFRTTRERYWLGTLAILFLLLPQILFGIDSMINGGSNIAFWGHVGGGLVSLLLYPYYERTCQQKTS